MLRVLDSAGTIYAGLTWRKDSDDLAVLRAATAEKRDGPTHALLAWRNVASATPRAFVYDPSTAKDFPAGMRTVAFRRPSWSDDGRIVFAGMAKWDEKIPEAAKTTNGDGADATEEPAGVEVWHARDVDVMPRQKISARTDRQRSMLAAWHVESNRFVQLGKSFLERVTPLPDQKLAYAVDWASYAMDRSIGRPASDLYLIDLETGARTKLQDRIEDQTLQASPGGRYLLYLQADQFYTIDTASKVVTNLTKPIATSFVDREVGRHGETEACVRCRRVDEERRSGPVVRQVRYLDGPNGWQSGDEADQRRGGSDQASLRAAGSGRRVHRHGQAGVRLAVWHLDEAVGIRAPERLHRPGRSAHPAGQGGGPARQSQGCRRLRLHRPGLRRSARCAGRRPVTQGRQDSRRHERVLHRLRLGALRARGIQERARRTVTGGAVLSRRIRAWEEIPDGRLHVREAV